MIICYPAQGRMGEGVCGREAGGKGECEKKGVGVGWGGVGWGVCVCLVTVNADHKMFTNNACC